MESDQQYAQRQVRQFKTDSLSQIVTSGPASSKLLVSRVRRDIPDHGFATPAKPDSVFSILVQLRRQERRELFLNDRLVHQGSFPERTVSVVNHLQIPKANLLSAFDTIIFTVPQAALDGLTEEQGVHPISALTCENEGRLDDTVWSLAQSLLPAFERPHEVGTLYAERILMASTTYFAHAFGGMRPVTLPRYDLSKRQLGRTVDLMRDRLDSDVSLSLLASETDLTARQFAQAFRRATGSPPDRWMTHLRIDQAKAMLRKTTLPVSQIATACGFANANHFIRMFTLAVGVGPELWRTHILN